MTRMLYITRRLVPVIAVCVALNATAAEAEGPVFRLTITDGRVAAAERTIKVVKGRL